MEQLEAVRAIYDAFGKGDVPTILSYLAEDVEWEYGATESHVPWLQLRHGRSGAGAFFSSLRDLDIRHFVAKTFLEAGQTIVVLVDIDATVRATGRAIHEENEVHLWHFNQDGLVARFRHRVDTLQHEIACRP